MRGSTRKRRHLRAALWMGLFLLVAHFGLLFVIERFQLLDQAKFNQGVRFIRRARAASPPLPVVAILGSSHTNDGVHPNVMLKRLQQQHGISAEAFNFSHPGAGHIHEYLTLRRLADRGALPDIAVIEVIVTRLTYEFATAKYKIRPLEVSAYASERLDLSRRGWVPLDNPLELGFWQTPWHANRHDLLVQMAPRWVDIDVVGVSGPEDSGCLVNDFYRCGTPDWEKRIQHYREEFVPQFSVYRLNRVEDEALNESIADCRRLGVRPVLLRTPEGPIFRSFFAPETAAKVEEYFAAIVKKHGIDCVDASRWFDDDAFFNDSHHLRKAGAEAFSSRLADRARSAAPGRHRIAA